jgi:hypothetical protein
VIRYVLGCIWAIFQVYKGHRQHLLDHINK